MAAVISLGVVTLWMWLTPMLFPELVKKPQPAQKTTTAATTTTGARTPAAARTAAPPAGVPEQQPASTPPVSIAPVSETKLHDTIVDAPEFIARFSNRGAELVSFKLKRYTSKDGQLVDLVKARPPKRADYPFAIAATNRALADELNSALWAVNERLEKGAHVIEYRYAAHGIAAAKTFRVDNNYLFSFDVSLTPPATYRVEIGPGIRTLEPDEVESRFVITGNGVVQRGGSVDTINREKSDRVNVLGPVDFAGMEDNYFMSVLKPERSSGAVIRAVELPIDTKGATRRDFYAGLNATPEGTVSGSAFFGPKTTQLLDKYGFEKTLQFGYFGIIARLFLIALVWINQFTHNFGWSIIVLTILIKIALYPLQHKSMSSMKKMQKLQPKMEAIKRRYAKSKSDPEQRQKMNADMMKLYQQEGVNPAGGCLPMIIQLPILWAFYNLLSHAIELRHAPWAFWLHDLAAKDPYYILPALMVVTMFLQQAMTPATVDPAQKKMFYIMPLVLGWIFKELPSGVVLYYFVQNVLTIAQQMIMNRYWKEHPTEGE